MIHFLRLEGGGNLVDAEAMPHDLKVLVDVRAFAAILWQAITKPERDEMVADFHDIQEMRGEWFEVVNCKEPSDDFCARKLKPLAEKYGLNYVTD